MFDFPLVDVLSFKTLLPDASEKMTAVLEIDPQTYKVVKDRVEYQTRPNSIPSQN